MAEIVALEDPGRSWQLRFVRDRDPDFSRPDAVVAPILDALFVLAPRLFTPLTLEMEVGLFDRTHGFHDGIPEESRFCLEVDSPDALEGADWIPARTRVVTAEIDRSAVERFVRMACDQHAPEGTAVCPSALFVRAVRARLPAPWSKAEGALAVSFEGGETCVPIARDATGQTFVDGPGGPILSAPIGVTAMAEGLEVRFAIEAFWSPWYDTYDAGRSAIEECVALLEARGWRIDRRTADRRQHVVHELLDSGAGAARYRGYAAGRPEERRLITVGRSQTVPRRELERRLALPVEGVMPLVYVGPVDQPDERIGWTGDCLVEVEPPGRPLMDVCPLTEDEGVRLGLELLEVVARAHAAGHVLTGIRPELVYCDVDAQERIHLTGLAPRAQLFLMTAPPAHGVPILADLYMAPEALAGTPIEASDVFSTCATLFRAISGRHPLGDTLSNQLSAITAGRVEPFSGADWLGNVLTRGLSVPPTARPSLEGLADHLTRRSAT